MYVNLTAGFLSSSKQQDEGFDGIVLPGGCYEWSRCPSTEKQNYGESLWSLVRVFPILYRISLISTVR